MKKLSYLIVAAGLTGLLLTIPTYSYYTKAKCQESQLYTKVQETIINIETAQQLENIIAKNKKVAVDVSATWCGPCKEYKPIFEEVAEEYKQVVFGEIVLDKISNKEEEKILKKYNLRYIPKTILFKNGKEAYSQFGSMDKKTLIGLVETYLFEKTKTKNLSFNGI